MFIAMLLFATLAIAWSWPGAYAGVISYGHAIFFGIGGYAVAVSNLRGGSPWYGALGGALGAVLCAALCGALCLRGRGYVFAAITLICAALAEPFAAAHDYVGPHSIYIFPARLGFLNLQFAAKWPYVLLAAVVFGAAVALTYGLRATRLRYYLHALQTDLAAARAVGVSALPPRLLVLVASAFVTSVAGSFFAQYTLTVSPHLMFPLSLSFDIALIGVLAGPRRVWGTPLVAALYVLLTRTFPLHPGGTAGAFVLIAEGVTIALIAVFLPRGVFSSGLRRLPADGLHNAA